MSWTRRGCAKWVPGGSIPNAWASTSPSSGPSSTSVASATAGISPSRAAAYGRRRSEARSPPIALYPTSASTRRSACLPGPAIGVAGGDFSHHQRERVVQIDPLGVGEADDDEQNVGELHRDRALRLCGLLRFLSEPVVHLPRQFTDFLREPGEIGERGEVSFLILADPPIDRLLGFAQGHWRLRVIVNAELPPLVAPFRGERYAASELSALIAPPYDVISSEDRTRYAARDSHNIVHLILPEAPSGVGRGGVGGGDRYAHAATLLAAWREIRRRTSPGWRAGRSSTSPTAITATRRRWPMRGSSRAATACSLSSCRRAILASRSSPPTASSLALGASRQSWSPPGGSGSRSGGWRRAWIGSSGWPSSGASAPRAFLPSQTPMTLPWS